MSGNGDSDDLSTVYPIYFYRTPLERKHVEYAASPET